MRAPRVFLFTLLLFATGSEASTIVALANGKVSMAINAELGSIVEFPKAIKTVTPSKYFQITDQGSSADPLQKMDIRTFQIKPTLGARPEEVVFVQADGRPISLQLVSAPDASKFYEVELEGSGGGGAGFAGQGSSKFLAQELLMMKAMLRDESGGFGRETLEEELSSEISDMEFHLKRVYSASLFTGYVFILRNKGQAALSINLRAMSFDKPNRAVLGHLERETLEPCPLMGENPLCETVLRVILRGQKTEPSSMLGQISHGQAPFMNSVPEGELK